MILDFNKLWKERNPPMGGSRRRVVDLETRKVVRFVNYADTEMGFIRRFLQNDAGQIYIRPGELHAAKAEEVRRIAIVRLPRRFRGQYRGRHQL